MPIMSTTATVNPPAPQKTDIKPIGICLQSNSEIPNVSTSTNSLNLSSNMKNNATNNFYTAATTSGHLQVGSLSVMVAKLNPSRQQTVILQPRINTTRGATVQIQNSVRGVTTNSQNISTSFASTPSSSISVRTRVLSSQANHANTIPLLNLTTVPTITTTAPSTNAANNSVKQMIAGPKFITSGNVETVNLVMTSTNDVRNSKTNATNNEIKSLYKINGPKPMTASAIVTQAPRMISINNAGPPCATRLGILGGSANNKPALINLAKNFIITPSGSSIANMVSISSANFSTNRIPTNQIIGRQTMTTTLNQQPTANIMPSNNNNNHHVNNNNNNNNNINKPTIYTVNANASVLNSNIITTFQPIISNNQNVLTSNVSLSTSSITTSSTLTNSTKPSIQLINNNSNCITNNNISPIKTTLQPQQPFSQQTSLSPRPRILSRKRPVDATISTLTIKQPPSNVVCNRPLIYGSSVNHQQLNQQNDAPQQLKFQQQQPQQQQQSSVTVPSVLPVICNNVETGRIDLINNHINNNNHNSNNNDNNNNSSPENGVTHFRKKPRKQLLEPTGGRYNKNFEHDHQNLNVKIDEDNDNDKNKNNYNSLKNNCERQEIKEKVILVKKPRPSLLGPAYKFSSNIKFQHFSWHSDVKPKYAKTLLLDDLLKEIKKGNEWKDYQICDQLNKLASDEELFIRKSLESFLTMLEEEISPFSKFAKKATLSDGSVEPKSNVDRICFRINDITRANIQRSKVLTEQILECRDLIRKITSDHEKKVDNLLKLINTNNNSSKRHFHHK